MWKVIPSSLMPQVDACCFFWSSWLRMSKKLEFSEEEEEAWCAAELRSEPPGWEISPLGETVGVRYQGYSAVRMEAVGRTASASLRDVALLLLLLLLPLPFVHSTHHLSQNLLHLFGCFQLQTGTAPNSRWV